MKSEKVYARLYAYRQNVVPKEPLGPKRHFTLVNTKIEDVRIENLDLSYAHFNGSTFKNVEFINCRLDWCKFHNVHFENVNIISCTVNHTDFDDSIIHEVEFRNVNGNTVFFDKAQIDNLHVYNSQMSSAYFDEANICHSWFLNSHMHKTSMSSATITNTQFERTWLQGICLNNANIDHVCFKANDMTESRMVEASMTNTKCITNNFHVSCLNYISIENSEFTAATLMTDITMINAKMKNVHFDESTVWANTHTIGLKLDNTSDLGLPPIACPETGGFIAYKKLRYCTKDSWCECVAKLYIPADAKRTSFILKQCRCSKAKVIEFYNTNGTKLNIKKASSCFNPITYIKGKYVKPDKFDKREAGEYAHGIHFFMTFDEAKAFYSL